jgi:hypothetical protein
MKSKLPACFAISSALRETQLHPHPAAAHLPLPGEVVKTTVCAPNACANFTPMCPNPPSPTTPTFLPLVTPQCRIGEYVVIPAQSSGAVPQDQIRGTLSTNRSFTTMLSE